MVAHPVAVAADVDDVAAMQQPIEQCGSHDLVTEDPALLLEALVGCEDGRGVPVAPVDELEEENRATLGGWTSTGGEPRSAMKTRRLLRLEVGVLAPE